MGLLCITSGSLKSNQAIQYAGEIIHFVRDQVA
jgi:hypothetical protein